MHQGLHQRCWTHLLRDIHRLKEQYPQHPGLAGWAQWVREVYDQAHPGPDPELPETVQRVQRVKLQQQCQQRLWSICQPYLGSDAPMRVPCQRVERFLPELFTFVAEPQAKADNNAAERSLRPTVVSRKISGGTRSPEGSNTKSVLASLFGTWRLRGRNPYQALNSILSQPLLAPVWTVTKFRKNVRLSVQDKCHSFMPPWYQMTTSWDPPGIGASEYPELPGIS